MWLTTYKYSTRQPLGPSVSLPGAKTLQDAKACLPGEPAFETKNTLIYLLEGDVAVCASWIRFAQ